MEEKKKTPELEIVIQLRGDGVIAQINEFIEKWIMKIYEKYPYAKNPHRGVGLDFFLNLKGAYNVRRDGVITRFGIGFVFECIETEGREADADSIRGYAKKQGIQSGASGKVQTGRRNQEHGIFAKNGNQNGHNEHQERRSQKQTGRTYGQDDGGSEKNHCGA